MSIHMLFFLFGRRGYGGVDRSGLKQSVVGMRIIGTRHRIIILFDRLWQDVNEGHGKEDTPSEAVHET